VGPCRVSPGSGLTAQRTSTPQLREKITGRFQLKLSEDRASAGTWLDYYEVMFADAIAGLRTTYMGRARRDAARVEPIDPMAIRVNLLSQWSAHSVASTSRKRCSPTIQFTGRVSLLR
jgi:hypothetical protein